MRAHPTQTHSTQTRSAPRRPTPPRPAGTRPQRLLAASLLCTGLALATAAQAQSTDPGGDRSAAATAGPVHQLRVYEMVAPQQAAFDARFRDHALRIMRGHGFDVVASWYSTDTGTGRTEFVYLLEWPDTATMQRGWEAFMADPEWARIKQESRRTLDGPIMGEILQDKVLVPTDWTPHRVLTGGQR